ncbi:hypothetical protein [Paraburkholderia ginsengiterrae]|nr:hypothetical protein [Paraburkholderia ginsengiterrae]
MNPQWPDGFFICFAAMSFADIFKRVSVSAFVSRKMYRLDQRISA